MELTIYNEGRGFVRERRKVRLKKGDNQVALEDFPLALEPTSLRIQAEDEVTIAEQDFEAPDVSRKALLERSLQKEITAISLRETDSITGTLVGVHGDTLIIKTADGISVLRAAEVKLPQLTESLSTDPVVRCLLRSERAREAELRISYLTGGLTWSADYVLALLEDGTAALESRVNLKNESGRSYEDAQLALVAGEVQGPVEMPQLLRMEMATTARREAAVERGELFEEVRELGDFHLYPVKDRVDLPDKGEKQLQLFSAQVKHVERRYVFDPARYPSPKIRVLRRIVNSLESGLGDPLPAGHLRVYTRGTDGQVHFLGEDTIAHTPRDEKVTVAGGSAFDLTGKRELLEHRKLGRQASESAYQVKLGNRSGKDRVVHVIERSEGLWRLVKESRKHVEETATKIRWEVPVAADSEETLDFTIREE